MDENRIRAGQKLLDAAAAFWKACHDEGQYGAVQWLIGSGGAMVVYTRGEYRDTIMANIDRLADGRVHYFRGESMPDTEED
jgi:hypothetical protein